MTVRTQEVKKPSRKKKVETSSEEPTVPETKTEKHDKAVAEIDAVLDEIDEVLEHDAYEFVRSYVQAGGQ